MSYPNYNKYNQYVTCCKPIGSTGATGAIGPQGATGATGPQGDNFWDPSGATGIAYIGDVFIDGKLNVTGGYFISDIFSFLCENKIYKCISHTIFSMVLPLLSNHIM